MISGDDSFKHIRTTEKRLGLLGLCLFIEPLMALFVSMPAYYAFIIGYFLGYISFIVLCETFIFSKDKPAIMAIMVFMANFKLIAIGLCVWGIHLLGFSAIEAILGIFFSQFAVTIMVVLNRKSKEKV